MNPGLPQSASPDNVAAKLQQRFRHYLDKTGVWPKARWVGTAASLLIFMDKCLEKTVEYCRQRMIFGKSLLDNQVLHFRLAELKTEVID